MAHRRDSPPEGYYSGTGVPPPVGGPPRRPPPRVHWDDRPSFVDSPSPPVGFRGPSGSSVGGSPRYRYSADEDYPPRGRYTEDSPPQRYLEGPPPGYQDSPPRRFPGRRNPPPQYLSPEDSPPYRYNEDAPPLRRYSIGGSSARPYSEDAPLPYDIDGPPPAGFRDDHPPPGFRDDHPPPRRFGPGGYRGEGLHRFAGSESPSPPPGFRDPLPPPPLPPRLGEPPRRFSRPAQQFSGGSSPPGPQQFRDESPPGFVDEPPRRFAGTPPGQFRTHPSPPGPGYAREDLPPRRLGAGLAPEEENDPSPPRKFLGTPPRRPDGPPPGYGEDHPFRRFPGGTPPSRLDDGSSPPLALPPSGAPLGPPRFPPDFRHSPAESPPDPSAVRYGPDAPPPLRQPDSSSSPEFSRGPEAALGYLAGRFHPSPPVGVASPAREGYRPPPPGLGTGSPLLPPDFATPPRLRPGADPGTSPPEFLFAPLPRRHPDGYTATSPPREPPRRPVGLGHDAIFTADVVPIELDDKLKEVQPHQGNPGSATGGGWKDLWVAFIFILHIGGITALCIIFGLEGTTKTIEHYGSPSAFHITNWFPPLGAAAIVGALFSLAWQTALRMAPVLMIVVTIWSGAALMSLFGIVLIATGDSVGLIGLAFLFVGLCQGLYAFVVRERIPFAGEMLKKALSVCGSYPSTFAVSYFFVLVSLFWLALWIFGFSGSGIRPKHAAIMAGLVVSLIWTMQVFRNIVRVTVAGTVSLFYFQERNMPGTPTYVALLRACTSSLGSICLGSLFVPLVEAPCHALRRINSQAGASEFLFSCVVCLLSCFEHLIRYFNKMGYIQVAIYGKPFVRASKDTWDMLQTQQVDVLVHDDLTSTILFIACGVTGSLSALVGGIWTFIAHKSLTIVISLISYLIGALIAYVTLAVVESGVATYYVCFAEDPASLQRYDGPLYERMWVRQMELQSPVTELTA